MTIANAPFVADELDHLLFAAFPGLVIRKDLAQEIRGTSKAPSYVIEFMLGKYCSNLFDDAEVREGLRFVHEEVAKYIPRGDETEKIKADIREHSPRRLIDMVKVELDQSLKEGVYWAHLMTANIHHVNISPQILEKYERLLLAGVWSRIVLHYDDDIRYRGKTFPFVISRLDPIQVSHVDLNEYLAGRAKFTRDQWIDALDSHDGLRANPSQDYTAHQAAVSSSYDSSGRKQLPYDRAWSASDGEIVLLHRIQSLRYAAGWRGRHYSQTLCEQRESTPTRFNQTARRCGLRRDSGQ